MVHYDITRIKWRLALIECLNKGAEELVRSDIRTTTSKTIQPKACLYPLEVTASGTARDTPQVSSKELSPSATNDSENVQAPPTRPSPQCSKERTRANETMDNHIMWPPGGCHRQ